YSLFACRCSDPLARFCPVAAGLPSAVESSRLLGVSLLWQVASAMAGCFGPGRCFNRGGLCQRWWTPLPHRAAPS
ncbi:hypothetical protein P7K49_039775, partial [Saguinus oedipus]